MSFEKISRRTGFIVLIFVILLAGGIYIVRELPVDIFPNLNYPLFNVITHYPAGSPSDIETLITKPIEQELFKLPHVRRVSSVSTQGFSQVTVEFDWGTSVKSANQLVLEAIASVQNQLPAGVKPAVENLGSALQEIVGYGVFPESKRLSLSELKYLVKKKIANRLRGIKGVYRVEVIGGEDLSFTVVPRIDAMMKYGITPSYLADIIRKNNYQVVIGYIRKGNRDFAIRGKGNIEKIAQLKMIPVKVIDGQPIFLKDIATVERGALPKRYEVYIDGRPGIAISIFKTKNASTVDVARRVNREMKFIADNFPYPVSFVKYYDQSEVINTAVKNLKNNIYAGALLVIIILFLFFGRIRDAILLAVVMPSIIILSFLFFPSEGLTLNMITIGALAVAMGMIVDDSIIVIENIIRYREDGKRALEAVKLGVKEIFAADLSGTLTTIAVFIPFIFISGLPGRFTGSFGLVMITTLLISLIVSVTIIPLVMSREKGKFRSREPLISSFLSWFINLNRKIFHYLWRHKTATVVGAIVIFIVSILLLAFSPASMLPPVDEGAILMEYVLPPGTSLAESSRIAHILEETALSHPAVVSVYRRTGSEAGTYQVEPVNRGELVIKLKPRSNRKESLRQVINDLRKATEKIPGVILLIHQVTSEKIDESMSGLPGVFGLTIYGENYKQLIDFSKKVEKIAEKTPGISEVLNISKYTVPVYSIKPLSGMLGKYGLTSEEVMKNLKYYLTGGVVSYVIKGQREIPIYLKASSLREKTANIGNLLKLPIKAGGRFVPLNQVVSYKQSENSNSITHINLQREVTLLMDIDASPNVIISRLKKNLMNLKIPPGIVLEFTGQYKVFLNLIGKMIFFGLISLLILYIIMGIQFGNYIDPLAIMFEIPFSFTGAFLAMEITRQNLNLSFLIGLITLLGVSVNNGIVLIDFINRRREEGLGIKEAIEEATAIRARPILLTALTSIFALIPISFGIGVGAKIQQSLAIAVIGGLALCTFLTLNFLPVVYGLLDRWKRG